MPVSISLYLLSSFENAEEAKTQQHLLLVEDDRVDQEAVLRALDRLGVQLKPQVTENGMEALEFVNSDLISSIASNPTDNFPNLIMLLDLNMPTMSGLELLRRIHNRSWFSNVAIFVVTTSQDPDELDSVRALEVKDVIYKSYDFDDFVERLAVITKFIRPQDSQIAGK